MQLAREYLEIMIGDGHYDDWEEMTGEAAPTQETRIVRVEPRNKRELAALEAFTLPCKLCIPGARDLWADCPVDFEEN